MRTLISEVLLPASASVGLLTMLTIPPAAAEDRALPQEATVTMAAVSAPVASAHQTAPSRSATEERAETPSNPTIEPRCERVERIGKFAITRCR
jgi:hypothetical protein